MPVQLIMMRHAKSDWSLPGVPDHERPLNARGRGEAARAAQALRGLGWIPDLIVSSTARRARSTAKRVARRLAFHGDRWLAPDLYLPDVDRIVGVLRSLPDRSRAVLVVGHNPGWEAMVGRLAGEPVALPTAAFACWNLPIDHWAAFDVDRPVRPAALWCPR